MEFLQILLQGKDAATALKFLVLSLLPFRTGHVGGRSTSTTLLLDGIEFLQILLQGTDAAAALKFLVLSLLPLRTGHVGGRSTSTTLILDGDDDDENNETLLDGIEFLLILLREIDGDGIFKEEFLSEARGIARSSLSLPIFSSSLQISTIWLQYWL